MSSPKIELLMSAMHQTDFSLAYSHIVTRGLSQIHPHPDARGNKSSGWGFELTIKWPNTSPNLSQAFHILDKLAECVDVKKDGWTLLFPPSHKIEDVPKELRGTFGNMFLVIPDTEIPSIDTIHGEVQFRQIVNVSAKGNAYLASRQNSITHILHWLAQEDANFPFYSAS